MFSSSPTLTDAWSRNKRAGFYQAWAAMEAFSPTRGRSHCALVGRMLISPPRHRRSSRQCARWSARVSVEVACVTDGSIGLISLSTNEHFQLDVVFHCYEPDAVWRCIAIARNVLRIDRATQNQQRSCGQNRASPDLSIAPTVGRWRTASRR
jgi:hypothetical protein